VQTNTGNPIIGGTGGLYSRSLADSPLDDIDPNSIESIDVLKGPSAASLYGTDAANGVIVIKTKRGQPGAFRLNVLGDQGWSYKEGDAAPLWYGYGHASDGTYTNRCVLTNPKNNSIGYTVADGTCRQDSVVAIQPSSNPDLSTLGTGSARNLSVDFSGGTQQLMQFFSSRASDNVGLAKLSDAETRRIVRMWGEEPPSWMRHPNTEQDLNATSRTDLQPFRALTSSVTAQGNYRDVLTGSPALATDPSLSTNGAKGSPSNGVYDTLTYLPGEALLARQDEIVKHGIVSMNNRLLPVSWLTLQANGGADYALRDIVLQTRTQDCTVVLTTSGCVAQRSDNSQQTFTSSFDLNGVLMLPLASWLTSRTAIGEQYNDTQFHQLGAGNGYGTGLAFGSDLLSPSPVAPSSTTALYAVTESRDESATAGWYMEETANLRERFFATVGFRQDVSSAFGENVNREAPIYPKLSLSWLISNEPFFPQNSILPTLRLRTAYGHSGKQAAQTAILNNFTLASAYVDDGTSSGTTLVPGIRLSSIGNANLKPERTTEWEGGFEASFLNNDRITLDVTAYHKLSKDAIVSTQLPDSYGTGAGTFNPGEFVNIGNVENKGTELILTAHVLETRLVSWDVTVNSTSNSNTLVKAFSQESICNSCTLTVQYKVGYPIFGQFDNEIVSYADKNHDGILSENEVVFSDTTMYLGAPYPKRENTYLTNLSFLGGALRASASFDHLIDMSPLQINNPATNRCTVDPTCSLAAQAAAIQAQHKSSGGASGRVNALRFQEFSLTYAAPARWAERLVRARSASVTLAARNLHLWTNYRGLDPNIDTGDSGFSDVPVDDGAGLAQPRNWTIRFNLGY
jgi:TonB-dependent SusC/RagA subfamily outer membrane receptor